MELRLLITLIVLQHNKGWFIIMNKNTKKRIQESITNLVNLGVIPADEAQLNTVPGIIF